MQRLQRKVSKSGGLAWNLAAVLPTHVVVRVVACQGVSWRSPACLLTLLACFSRSALLEYGGGERDEGGEGGGGNDMLGGGGGMSVVRTAFRKGLLNGFFFFDVEPFPCGWAVVHIYTLPHFAMDTSTFAPT